MKQKYPSDACDSLKPSSLIGINECDQETSILFARSRRRTQGFSSCARFAACSRLMRAASVDEPHIANGAGIRRDVRRLSCVANGRRATTSAQLTFFFGASFLFGKSGGVNGLRARGEGQLQDALCEGLEGTVSELQSLVMAMDSYNWTAHTTSSATRSRERHCFESDTASIATSLRERHNFERDTT
jgi:hypothetical protein